MQQTAAVRSFSSLLIASALLCGAALTYAVLMHSGLGQSLPDALKSRAWMLGAGVAVGLLGEAAVRGAAKENIGRRLINWQPARQSRWVVMAAIFFATIAYLIFANDFTERTLTPFWHDDQMHTLQARILAAGHFSMPQHPLADFFETFHVFVKPIYGGIHFLGTSLLNAPALALGLPSHYMPLMIGGLIAAMTYRLLQELLGHWPAMLGVLMLWSLDQYRFVGPRMTSHAPMLLLGLLLIWAWLHWRQNRSWRWMATMGAFAGLAAITRPVDALGYAAPVAVAVLLNLRGLSWQTAVRQIAIGVAAGAVFLLLQLCFNHNVTGRWFYTPYQYYNDLNYPNINYGVFEAARDIPPMHVSDLQQKQEYYDHFLMPFLVTAKTEGFWHTVLVSRPAMTVRFALPDVMLCLLLPIGLIALRRPAVVVAAVAGTYMLFYAPHLFYLPHYPAVIAPAVLLIVLQGCRGMYAHGVKWRWIGAAATGLCASAAVATLPPFQGWDDVGPSWPDSTWANEQMPKDVQAPAIVLFHYSPGVSTYHDEPVYTASAAWPDDAPIIRAHNLGPERNRDLVKYYAEGQPDRGVWLFDRGSRKLLYLGNVRSLLEGDVPVGLPYGAVTRP
ncbi:MAG TPA: glycosyltransferase family 39 protein [Tepidisphaeraceae bacterium]